MEAKLKKCKGTGKAKGHGCGKECFKRTFGICDKCLREWATTTEVGLAWLRKQMSYKIANKKKVERKKFVAKKRELNIKGAMQLADTYFSRFMRLYYSLDGKCTCYTCGSIKDIKEVDNGHYMKREHKATRYEENNCRPQCVTCNRSTKHNGKQAEFRVHLVHEIGETKVEELEFLSRTTIKANSVFYREIADYYRLKVNELQKQLKVKIW